MCCYVLESELFHNYVLVISNMFRTFSLRFLSFSKSVKYFQLFPILLPTIFQMCSIDFQGLFQLLSKDAEQTTCDPQGRMGSRAAPEKTCDGQGRVASRAESKNCVRCAGTGWLTGRDVGKRAMLRDGLARGPRRRKTCDAQ
jgi:hypothetical protein